MGLTWHAKLVLARQHHHPLVPGVLHVKLDKRKRKIRKGDVLAVEGRLWLAPVVKVDDGFAEAFGARQLEHRKVIVNLVQHAPNYTEQPKRPGVLGEVVRAVGRQQAGVRAVVALRAAEVREVRAKVGRGEARHLRPSGNCRLRTICGSTATVTNSSGLPSSARDRMS